MKEKQSGLKVCLDWVRKYWVPLVSVLGFFLLFLLVAWLYNLRKSTRGYTAYDLTPYRSYIAAYTTGVISSKSEIKVEFTREVVKPDEVGKKLSGGLLSFSPRIKGELRWVNTRTLQFTPRESLPWGQAYKAELRLDRVFDDLPKELSRFPFHFSVVNQSYEIEAFHYVARRHAGVLEQGLRGLIYTADVISHEVLRDCLEVTVGGKPLECEVTDMGGGCMFGFVAWGKGWKGGEKVRAVIRTGAKKRKREYTADLVLPSLDTFSLVDHYVVDGERQSIELYFSHPLDDQMSYEGLFDVVVDQQVYVPRITVRDNSVILEFDKPVLGDAVVLRIDGAVRSDEKVSLGKGERLTLSLMGPKPMVEFLDQGSILPSVEEGSVQIPFLARGLRAVDVTVYRVFSPNLPQFFQVSAYDDSYELHRVGELILRKTISLGEEGVRMPRGYVYALDLSNIVQLEPGALYRVGLSIRRELTRNFCEPGSTLHSVTDASDLELGDYQEYIYASDYCWQERNDPSKNTYYYSLGFQWKNLLVTDLGILAKTTPMGSVKAWVTSLTQGAPMAGVQLELLDQWLQPMGSTHTDGEGMAAFASGGHREPFLLIASQGAMRSYLPLQGSQMLSFSSFDVDGQHSPSGLQGFLYGERGVWSPGDSIHIGFILFDREQSLPQGHPVEMRFIDPKGDELDRVVFTGKPHNHYQFGVATRPDAMPGRYRMVAKVGKQTFSKVLRVEHVRPNRLHVKVKTPKECYATGDVLPLHVKARWLHGALARNMNTEVTFSVNLSRKPFPDYEEYTFVDDNSQFPSQDIHVVRSTLDDVGEMERQETVPLLPSAPGLLDCHVQAKVLEVGGGESIGSHRIKISPYASYVGLRVPNDEGYFLPCDQEHRFQVVSLLADGRKNASPSMQVDVYQLSWDWWWEHNDESVAQYIHARGSTHVKSITKFQVEGGVHSFGLRVPNEEGGRYLVRVVDKESGHASSSIVYFGVTQGDRGKHETVLALTADKEKYTPGDKARITIPTALGGMVLVSIENGTGIVQTTWVTAQEGQTEFRLPIEESMAPNVYVTATLLQPYEHTANDLPLRLYGTIPLLVESDASRLEPLLTVPEEIRVGEKATIQVKESKGRPMSFTLAVVDEGLLGLTGFSTPDPWEYFHAKQALGVNTYDLFDRVIGAYAGAISNVLSVGGDEFAEGGGERPLESRLFEPVVRFYGPIELSAKGTAKVDVRLEDYIGEVRVMVVGCNEGAQGSAWTRVPVRSPLMAQLSLPEIVSPYDTLAVPVTVFSSLDAKERAQVQLAVSGSGRIVGKAQQEVTLDEEGDNTAWYCVGMNWPEGSVQMDSHVKLHNKQAQAKGAVLVRSPLARDFKSESVLVRPGAKSSLRLNDFASLTNLQGVVQVSSLPSFDLERHYQEAKRSSGEYVFDLVLEGIAHGVYAAFGAESSSNDEKVDYASLVGEVVQALQRYQTPSGGFSLWPGYMHPHTLASSFAGEFLLMAKREGYYVPVSMLRNWASYQRVQAQRWRAGSKDEPDVYQAYRLYTLALAGEPSKSDMNRLREGGERTWACNHFLAAAYGVSGHDVVARKMVTGGTRKGNLYASMALYTYLLHMEDDNRRVSSMERLARELRELYWGSSFEVGRSLLMMCRYAQQTGMQLSGLKGKLTANAKEVKVRSEGAVYRKHLTASDGGEFTVSWVNEGEAPVYVTLSASGVPRSPAMLESQQGVSLFYEALSRDLSLPCNYKKLEQGESFVLAVHVKNETTQIQELMLHLPLPAGWEVVNPTLSPLPQVYEETSFDYRGYGRGVVNTYFTLSVGEQAIYYFLVNTSYQGEFYFPPVECSSQYEASVRAVRGGERVRVIPWQQ